MSVNKISMIIPTYNERDNLQFLVKRIDKALSNLNYELIIVDDNSPDGTGELAEKLSKDFPIKIIHREGKKGLASAVIDGFKHAEGEVLGVMDADLQHPPENIPELLREIKRADIVIGSRYIENGKIDGWSFKREIISKGAGILAHILLPKIRSIKDPLSGFFLLKSDVIEGVDLNPIGYKILLEILVKGNYNDLIEVPYIFKERGGGKSNLNIKEHINYLKHLYKLARTEGEINRFFKFCLVGSIGVFVNMGLLWFLTEIFGLFYLISAIFSIESAILSNFSLNEFWTFKDRGTRSIPFILTRALKFNLVSIGGLVINIGVLLTLTEILGVYYLISNLFGIAVAVLWNFTVNTWWTWK